MNKGTKMYSLSDKYKILLQILNSYIFLAIFSTLIFTGSYFLIHIVGARLLTQDDYGEFVLFFTLITAILILPDISFGQSMIRFFNGVDLKNSFQQSIIVLKLLSFSLSLIILIILNNIIHTLGGKAIIEDSKIPLLVFVGITNLFLNQIRQLAKAMLSYKKAILIEFINFVFYIVFIILLDFSKISLVKYLLILSFSNIGSIIIGLFIFRKLFSKKISLYSNFKQWPPIIFKYFVYLALSGFSIFLFSRIDTLTISYFVNESSVAIYGVVWLVYSTYTIVYEIIHLLTIAILPKGTDFSADEKISIFQVSVSLRLIFIIPLTIVIVLFGNQIINLIFGNNYEEAAILAKILTIAGVLKVISNSIGSLWTVIGKPNYLFVSTIFSAVLGFIMSFSLVYHFKLAGAIAGIIITQVLAVSFTFIFFMKKEDIKIGEIFKRQKDTGLYLKSILFSSKI